jgi:hypothetical protein
MLLMSYNANAQSNLEDKSYKFTIFLTSDWIKTKVEETPKKDAISYSFDNRDGENALMILAFKVNGVKDLDDLIYNVEKDISLNIPKRSGDYNYDDYGNFERKKAVYKDDQVVETIYYFTTKDAGSTDNYAYVVRFITLANAYNSELAKEIDETARTFEPL